MDDGQISSFLLVYIWDLLWCMGENIFIWKFPLVGTKLKQNGCSAGQIINHKMKLYLLLTETDGYCYKIIFIFKNV